MADEIQSLDDLKKLLDIVKIKDQEEYARAFTELIFNLKTGAWQALHPEVWDTSARPCLKYFDVKFHGLLLLRFLLNNPACSTSIFFDLPAGNYETLKGEKVQLYVPDRIDLSETRILRLPWASIET